MTLTEILDRAEKARVLAELKVALASVLGAPGNVPVPRGWTAGERLLFEALPFAVQEIIGRRRDLDSREIRKLQNSVAEIRRSLTPSPRRAQIEKETENV
jgi:hypothetical protein